MTFFPEIDIERSKTNAKRKLREYQRWRRIAGDVGEQKITATYSFEPKQKYGSPSKVVERLAINRLTAESEVEAIRWAVSHLLEPNHRRILIEKYLSNSYKEDTAIYTDLSISESFYYELLEGALLAFAELYRNGSLLVEKCGVLAEF